METELRSKKIPQNRLGTASVIPRKKVLIPRHSEVYGRVYSEAWNDRKWHEKKLVLQKILLQQTELTACFCPKHALEWNSELLSLPQNGSEQNSKCLLIILLQVTDFRVVFSSVELFRTEFRAFASNFVPWYRIPILFLLCGTIQNRIPRIFCSAEKPEFRRTYGSQTKW